MLQMQLSTVQFPKERVNDTLTFEAERWANANGDPGFLEDHLKTVSPPPSYRMEYGFWSMHRSGFSQIDKHPKTNKTPPEPKTIREISHIFHEFPENMGEEIAKDIRTTFNNILDLPLA